MISQISPQTSESIEHDPELDFAIPDLWPDEPDPDPRETSVWGGALFIALTSVGVIVLLGVALFQTGYRVVATSWIWIGLPVVRAAAAAVRISARRLRQAASRHVVADVGATR
jgi:hypothetical protein